ncbi:low-density lipoprotein receptor-related protein 6 isoform X2 [Aplysia californica]|uniref:Low-density lipoprotein receptor-related protein 6 isoform X2 n=1 Tax=Aplysia californica TaxID=6500 RepID=A0ABM0K7E1_APLCA|nr:low-density lipoprotein receptor-related protein 6 isoform X2 [Aplysia californica]
MGEGTSIPAFIVGLAWISTLCYGNPLLLFANHEDVQIIDVASPTSNGTILISGLEDAAAVDFIYSDGVIFWSDVSLEVIKRVYLNDTKHPKTVVATGLVSPDGLACDWLGRKLYWTDSETNRIEVSNLDGEHRKVLIWQRLDQPRAIALDPENGYMYWTDWGETPKIEKAGMDGNEETRSVIVSKNIHWPNGLTIDYAESKIYWADAKLSLIHSCDFDGGNRRPVVEGSLPHPFALTVSGDSLYWTDWHTHSIHGCNKLTGAKCFLVLDDIYAPMDIHAFMPSRQPNGRNMCGDNNGGCSHLCLMSPTPPYFTCACPTGIRLLADQRTCAKGAEKILFLARRQDIRQISLDTPDYTDVLLPLDRVKHAIALDYDSTSGFVYWTDDEVQTIQRAQLDGSEQETLVDTEVDDPNGIAIDWIAQNLYWTDTGTDRIEVSRLNGSSRKVLISDGLDQPRAICLDPEAGYMYWTDWGKKPRIEKAYLDGTNRIAVVSTNLGWPNGLAIDLEERKLYWGDARKDCIEVSDLDGRNRRKLVTERLPHIFGFSLLGDYIYWTEWQDRTIERVNKHTGLNRTKIIAQLPDLMGLKAADVNRVTGTNTCGENNGNCSHLCLFRPSPKKHVCACPMGLELRADGQTCIVPEAFLLFSSRSDIRRISLETNQNNQAIPIQGVQKAMAIDFDITDNRIYWTDVELQHISRAFMNGSSLQHIIQFGLDYPEGMAVDWVAHNIYWADTGKNRIEVARLDGSSRKVLVWRNLEEPRALALDPPNGFMYWTVWGDEPVLERAHLDGTHRKVLISKIGHVQDLTIDYVDRRLYWTDVSDHSIKSSDMNGGDQRLVVQSQIRQPLGLSQYQDFVYWTDFKRKTIERANKTDGLNRTMIQGEVDLVMDILVFHTSRQSGSNACGRNNGGCSHLCLAHPAENSKNTSHYCACPTHYTLNDDQLTCSAPEQYLLLSTRNATIRLVIQSDNAVDNPEVVLPINGMKNIRALAYDPVGEFIYWIEGRQKTIKRAHDNGTMTSVVVNEPKNVFQPFDIAVDPYARTLYWTCTSNNVINVTRIDAFRSPIGVIMQSSGGFKPRSLVLYPEKGKMFFTNMVSSPRIEMALMDGSEAITLFKNVLVHPQSLTIDKKENRLYWADSRLNRIELSDLTGGNRRILVDGQVDNPRGLAVYGKFLYWLAREQNNVERIHKKTGNKRFWVRGRIQGLSDMIAVEHSMSASWHPCFRNNSGCSHLCFITEDHKPRCSCPIHLVLKSDRQTCSEPPTCASDQFKCTSGGVQCIPLVWKCDYSPECEDSSDEENCLECRGDQFKCSDEKCVDAAHRCDGQDDCGDGSDERNCCEEGGENCKCADCAGQPDCTDTNGKLCPEKGSPDRNKSSKNYTIAIVIVVVVFVVVVIILILVCRHKTSGAPVDDDIVMVKKPLNPPAAALAEGSSPHNTLIRGKSQATGLSMGSGSGPPFYDRNHVTGASSSSSTVTQYPQETLNPPPSPVTDRSVYTAPTGGIYVSVNSLASSVQRSGVGSAGGGVGGGGGSSSRRRNHHRRHHHHHHHHHIPPPPTTPCSTDVCEDSEPYHPHSTPLHSSTPANKYRARSSRSRSARSNAKKFKYYFNNSVVELNYDSDPYPPPPTPRSHYFSDEISCPPSPSTERSYFNPYPPPPSPVATSDC